MQGHLRLLETLTLPELAAWCVATGQEAMVSGDADWTSESVWTICLSSAKNPSVRDNWPIDKTVALSLMESARLLAPCSTGSEAPPFWWGLGSQHPTPPFDALGIPVQLAFSSARAQTMWRPHGAGDEAKMEIAQMWTVCVRAIDPASCPRARPIDGPTWLAARKEVAAMEGVALAGAHPDRARSL